MTFDERSTDWMFTNDIKTMQRKLNSFVRKVNTGIEHDDLWRGRFFIRQISRNPKYEGDYMECLFTLRFVDKKTLKYVDYCGSAADWCFPGTGYGLWRTMNDFIVEDCNVWKDGKPSNDVDYTKINSDKVLSNSEPLFSREFNLRRTKR